MLAAELRNSVGKPDRIYKDQIKINPKRVKNLTEIEDLVMIQPTSAESNQDNYYSASLQDPLFNDLSIVYDDSEVMLALTDG